jgi:conjugative relaxase-like TrwC/TraI family protein
VQSTHKIAGSAAVGFAAYLTGSAQRGDYYVGGELEGEGGSWHGSSDALAALGLDPARPVRRSDLVSLMEGRSPRSGEAIRRLGPDGSRVAGVDLTFSAPKSVSALWAVSSPYRRAQIEVAHRRAVASALERVERAVPVVRRRIEGAVRHEPARSLVAAEFVHTSSRLTRDQERDGVPDPQLHSHVVVVAAQRSDGGFGAVDSRELFRSQRVNGAWYRAQLAGELQGLGLKVERRTGRDGRFFEVAGVPRELVSRWSRRSEVIERAARAFQQRYGRAPRAGELAGISVATRGTKTVTAEVDVSGAWRAVGEEYGLTQEEVRSLFESRERGQVVDVRGELLGDLTRDRSMVTRHELEARALEISAGVEPAERAIERLATLEQAGELIALDDGWFTTRELRGLEEQTLETATGRVDELVAAVSRFARDRAVEHAHERLGAGLSCEQRNALDVLTGRGGVVVLVGEAGTGKGVVLGAARAAWEHDGYRVIGAAVAGAAAQRLGTDAGIGETMTLDALTRRVENARLQFDQRTVVVFDEAGMADTRRLATIIEQTRDSGSKLVLAGDSAQLSPIGAGGLFREIQDRVPTAALSEVYRANHAWERAAWTALRAGDAQSALAAYHEHGRLQVFDTRDQAAGRMVSDWAAVRDRNPADRVVMITDASNFELDQLNRQAQQHRADRGELGEQRVPLPDRPYGLARSDEVLFASQHHVPGEQRVENGTRGQVVNVDEHARLVRVRTMEPTARDVEVTKQDLAGLRLSYAQHVYKAQGMTTDRALVLTGGWQADREHAYVALTRAREETDIYTSREDLGREGINSDAIKRLAQRISKSHAQQASLTREPLTPGQHSERQPAETRNQPRDPKALGHDKSTEHQAAPENTQERVRISQRYNTPSLAAREPATSTRGQDAASPLKRDLFAPHEREQRPAERDTTTSQQVHEPRRIGQLYTQPGRDETAPDRESSPREDRDIPLDRDRGDVEHEEHPERGPYGQRMHDLLVSQQIEQALDHDRGEGIEI